MSTSNQLAHPSLWQRARWKIGPSIAAAFGIPGIAQRTEALVRSVDGRTALDLGCGVSSHLSSLRPRIKTFGVDADPGSIEASRERSVHDGYALADIISQSVDELRERLEASTGLRSFDVVTAYGVIEHVKKSDGWELMEKCEALATKLVILETPNGFVPQGAEFGNPLQRHLSGWTRQDFEGVGYSVFGTTGTKYLRGYMGESKVTVPGALLFDQVVLSRLLRCDRAPHHAFNLAAFKDVRGVEARYATREDFRLRKRVA